MSKPDSERNAALEQIRADPSDASDSAGEARPGERERDEEGQALAENEQQQPRTITDKLGNAIEDLIPGDSDNDGH